MSLKKFFMDSSENGKLFFVFPVWRILATIFGKVKAAFCVIDSFGTIRVIHKAQLYYYENKGCNSCFESYHFVVKMIEDFKMKVLYCLILTSLAITQLNFMLMCFVTNQRHQLIQQNRQFIRYISFNFLLRRHVWRLHYLNSDYRLFYFFATANESICFFFLLRKW